jgi:DNA primase
MEITAIKSRLTLATVLSYYSLKPDKNLRLNCPFHEDKTPSLQVYYKTHTAYCFSSNCKTHGKSLDVIDFVLHKENTDKHNAILKCVEIINYLEGKVNHQQKPIQVNPLATLSVSKELFLQNMFTYFKNAVHNSKPAQDYINSRNLDAVRVEIGYNSGQFHHGNRRDETLINNCMAIGFLAPWGVNNRKPNEVAYKAFGKECICFALRNKNNQITGMYFRSTINNKDQRHFYLKESTGLYPNYPNPDTKKLIIAESIIDAASLLQIGAITSLYSILAAYGTNRLNDEMQAAIKELNHLQEIIFAFDNDEAGNKAAEKYSEELKILLPNIILSKIILPNKDINETLQAHCDEQIFIDLLNERTTDFSFSIEKENAATTTATAATLFIETETVQPKSKEKKEAESIEKNHSLLNTTNPNKLLFTTLTAIYIIKGGVDKQLNKLQVTIEIINEKLTEGINRKHFKIDLYDSKQVEKAISEANDFLQLLKNDVANDLHHLTEALDKYREAEIQQSQSEEPKEAQQYILTSVERNEALKIANDKKLIPTITQKLTQSGIIGEDDNKVFLFAIAASHIQQNPLNALIQGSSGSGKTRLLKQIFACMPDETKKIYSRLSEKMLYNVPKYYFQNKLICFEDVDGLGEEAVYAWRELVSNGELISGVSYKDEKGNIGIKELIVYGPITSIACTTHGRIYTDNMNRLFLIAIDESKAQTKKIIEYQAKEAANQINQQVQQTAINQLKNFVRILQPYKVYNPHALRLLLPEGIQDERRLYKLYIYFIDMVTVLHQYQRKQTADGKLIATKQDCQLAKDLMFECIMLKMDELDGSLRQFFERLKDYVKKTKNDNHGFTQREIRQSLHISKTQLHRFIIELTELEYLQEMRYNGNKGNTYQIRYWDDYKKVRTEVKQFLQDQIDKLQDE